MIRREGKDRTDALQYIYAAWQEDMEQALQAWKVQTDEARGVIHQAMLVLDADVRFNQYCGKGSLKSYVLRLCKKKFIALDSNSNERLLWLIHKGGAPKEMVFDHIDKDWKKSAMNILLSQGANPVDAENAIQEAMEVLLERVQDKSFEVTSTLKAYFIGICKKKYHAYNRRQIRTGLFDDAHKFEHIDEFVKGKERDTPEDLLLSKEKYGVLLTALKMLSPTCQEVLRLWSNGYSQEEIMEKLKLKNTGIVAGWVFRCKNKLKAILQENPKFKKFFNVEDE